MIIIVPTGDLFRGRPILLELNIDGEEDVAKHIDKEVGHFKEWIKEMTDKNSVRGPL